MPLTEELSRLLREHTEGKLSEAALRESLRRLADDDGPDRPVPLHDELTKLRRDAAINRLDREFEEIRKECLIRSRGSYYEPSVNKFWGHFWAVVFMIGALAAAIVFPLPLRGLKLWIVPALLALVTGMAVNFLAEIYRKGSRLDRAKAIWQDRRAQLADEGSKDGTSAFGPTSL